MSRPLPFSLLFLIASTVAFSTHQKGKGSEITPASRTRISPKEYPPPKNGRKWCLNYPTDSTEGKRQGDDCRTKKPEKPKDAPAAPPPEKKRIIPQGKEPSGSSQGKKPTPPPLDLPVEVLPPVTKYLGCIDPGTGMPTPNIPCIPEKMKCVVEEDVFVSHVKSACQLVGEVCQVVTSEAPLRVKTKGEYSECGPQSALGSNRTQKGCPDVCVRGRIYSKCVDDKVQIVVEEGELYCHPDGKSSKDQTYTYEWKGIPTDVKKGQDGARFVPSDLCVRSYNPITCGGRTSCYLQVTHDSKNGCKPFDKPPEPEYDKTGTAKCGPVSVGGMLDFPCSSAP